MPAFSPRGYKNPATTGEINDPAFWKTVGESQDARFVELDANQTGAAADAAQALQTANAFAGQIAQANTTAGEAKDIAQGAVADVDEIKGPIVTRLTAVETAAGYAPGDATDAAMTNIATQEGTQFRAALNAQIAAGPGIAYGLMFKGTNLITVGSSTLEAYSPGGAIRWNVRDMFGFTHPHYSITPDTGFMQRAVGGWRASDMAIDLYTGDPWPLGTRGLVIYQGLLNSARQHGLNPDGRAQMKASLRMTVAILNAARIEHIDALTAEWTGSWADVAHATAWGGMHKSAGAVGDTVTLTMPDKGTSPHAYHLVTRAHQSTGPSVLVENVTTGETLGTLDLSGTTSTEPDLPVPVALIANAGDQVRLTVQDNTGGFTIESLIVPATTPNPIMAQKERHLLTYTPFGDFGNGSDAAVDAANTLLDELALDYDNIFVTSPEGYWDKTKHISADGVHANLEGYQALTKSTTDGIIQWVNRGALRVDSMGHLPSFWPVVGPTIVADDFNRATSDPWVTSTGGRPWEAVPASDMATHYSILSGQLSAALGRTAPASLVVDTGRSNGTVEATMITLGTGVNGGLVFRMNEAKTSGLMLHHEGGFNQYRLRVWDGLTWEPVIAPIGTGASGDRLKVTMDGPTITAYINGVQLFTYQDTEHQANTRHGLGTSLPSSTQSRIDDFYFTSEIV